LSQISADLGIPCESEITQVGIRDLYCIAINVQNGVDTGKAENAKNLLKAALSRAVIHRLRRTSDQNNTIDTRACSGIVPA